MAQKASDRQISDAYDRLHSVWKVADELGMCGQSVHERLARMGVDMSQNRFTKDDERYLADRYVVYRDGGMLQALADEMGRTKQFICRKAGTMGLTDKYSSKRYSRVWMDSTREFCQPFWNDFKRSRDGIAAYCKRKHYGEQSFCDAMRRNFPEEYEEVVRSKKPKRSQYARGRDFEYSVRDDMRKHGYIAMRSPGSKSPADIYCVKRNELIFIQCKVSGALFRAEWNEFMSFCDSVGATPVMAERPSGGGIAYHELLDWKDEDRKPGEMRDWRPSERDGEEKVGD